MQTMMFCPKSLKSEPEERFHNHRNVISPQGFGEIGFVLPYLLIKGRGEKGRILSLKIKHMALSFLESLFREDCREFSFFCLMDSIHAMGGGRQQAQRVFRSVQSLLTGMSSCGTSS